jgi:hypothetical protein
MEIEILSHSHFPSADRGRVGQLDTLVIYRVDGKRNDTVLLTGEVDDPKILAAKIADKVKKTASVVGHKFTV